MGMLLRRRFKTTLSKAVHDITDDVKEVAVAVVAGKVLGIDYSKIDTKVKLVEIAKARGLEVNRAMKRAAIEAMLEALDLEESDQKGK